jgi:hypothetical protein
MHKWIFGDGFKTGPKCTSVAGFLIKKGMQQSLMDKREPSPNLHKNAK